MHVIELISLDSVDVGDPSKEINIVVEIPKGSSIKYEFDTATGLLFVDRKLYTAMNYPFNYGFIPKTLEMDGDPVDALILGEDPVVPLSIVKSRPIGRRSRFQSYCNSCIQNRSYVFKNRRHQRSSRIHRKSDQTFLRTL